MTGKELLDYLITLRDDQLNDEVLIAMNDEYCWRASIVKWLVPTTSWNKGIPYIEISD